MVKTDACLLPQGQIKVELGALHKREGRLSAVSIYCNTGIQNYCMGQNSKNVFVHNSHDSDIQDHIKDHIRYSGSYQKG